MSGPGLRFKVARRLATIFQEASTRPVRFNEAVDEENGAIFVAVPKTGTTSIRNQMRRTDVDYQVIEPHLSIREIRDGLRAYFLFNAMHKNRAYPCDAEAHKSYDEVIAEHQRFFNDSFKFSTVRNPWARVVSLYNRREGLRVAGDMDFTDFCLKLRYASDTCNIPTRHDCQIDWLTDETGTLLVDHVMRLEEMGDELQKISDLSAGRVKLTVSFDNMNPASKSRNYRDLFSPEAREHVSKIFARDIEAFGYSF